MGKRGGMESGAGGDGEWCGKWPVRGVLIRVNLIIKFIIP